MIIAKVTLKNAAQMAVVENDQMIEALTTYASNHPLGVWILPRASWSRPHFPNTHSLNSCVGSTPHRLHRDHESDSGTPDLPERLRRSVVPSTPPPDVRSH